MTVTAIAAVYTSILCW